jgi:hypothetical protein
VYIVQRDLRSLEITIHDGAARLVRRLVERRALVHAAARGLLAGARARGHRVLGLHTRAGLHVVVQLLAPQQEERVVVLAVRHLLDRRVLEDEVAVAHVVPPVRLVERGDRRVRSRHVHHSSHFDDTVARLFSCGRH